MKIKNRKKNARIALSKKWDAIIEDGFGSVWTKKCCMCNCLTMYIVRPGEVQCGNCG